MIYYKVKCKYSLVEGINERTQKRIWEDISTGIHDGKTQYKLLVYNHDETAFEAVIAFSVKENSLSSIKKIILNEVNTYQTGIKIVSFSGVSEEITVEKAISLTLMGLKAGYD